jgi:hypothetical protein
MVWFTVPYFSSVDGQRLSDLHCGVTFSKCINCHLNLPVTMVEMQGNGCTCCLWTILRLKKLEASFDQRWWFIAPFIVRLSAQHSCFLISGHVSLLFVLRAINQSVFNFRFCPKFVEKFENSRWPLTNVVKRYDVCYSSFDALILFLFFRVLYRFSFINWES